MNLHRQHFPTLALLSFAIILAGRAFTVLPTVSSIISTVRIQTRSLFATSKPPSMGRTPVYFVSHGGPTTMFDTVHPVFSKLREMGREITQKVKPTAVIVFSAHWQSDHVGAIEVNTSEQEPLLYDFYGFPRHYYMEKYPNKGSAEIARKVITHLNKAGIKTFEADRGLDHGVFVPFKIMFSPEENPLNVPIIQVSLFDDDNDADAHIKLGRAVEKLRDENIVIIVSGMAVHNLRDFHMTLNTGMTLPYAVSFDAALKEAVESTPGDQRDQNMVNLLKRPDARRAHPTFEHLLPIHIGVGAAGTDSGKQTWTLPEGSMSWGQYRFGEVGA